MLRNGSGIKIAIRIVYLILLILLAVAMFLGLKWFAGYLEVSSISEVWPEGEVVIYHCGLVGLSIAAIIFFVRMLAIDFERQMLKSKLKEQQRHGPKDAREEKPVQEIKPVPKQVPVVDTSEVERLRAELEAERKWRRKAGMVYPNLEKDVAEFPMNF